MGCEDYSKNLDRFYESSLVRPGIFREDDTKKPRPLCLAESVPKILRFPGSL